MRQLKNKVDVYFGMDEIDVEGQFIFYGMIFLMSFIMVVGTISKIFL